MSMVDGISVIQRLQIPGLYRVHLLLVNKDYRSFTSLVFEDATAPAPQDSHVAIAELVWNFRKGTPRHGWFSGRPSIQVMSSPTSEVFHNGYDWVSQYVEMIHARHDRQPMQNGLDDAYKVHRELNNQNLSGPDRTELFDWLRRQGFIY